jgi:hypothetical protein
VADYASGAWTSIDGEYEPSQYGPSQLEQTRIQFSTTLSAALVPVQEAIAELRLAQGDMRNDIAAVRRTQYDEPVTKAVKGA